MLIVKAVMTSACFSKGREVFIVRVKRPKIHFLCCLTPKFKLLHSSEMLARFHICTRRNISRIFVFSVILSHSEINWLVVHKSKFKMQVSLNLLKLVSTTVPVAQLNSSFNLTKSVSIPKYKLFFKLMSAYKT